MELMIRASSVNPTLSPMELILGTRIRSAVMDTDLVIAMAQLLTGIATFIVANFLAAQLRIKKKQLEIAHIGSDRILAFASRTRT